MLSAVSCFILTAESQKRVRGHSWIIMLHVKSLLQEPGREEEWVRKEACFPLGQSDVRTHIPVGFFFSFLFFYFATKCPETQWPHSSLFPCLIWANLSYPSQPQRSTRLHKSCIKHIWTINKRTRNCSGIICRRTSLLQAAQGFCGNGLKSQVWRKKPCPYC